MRSRRWIAAFYFLILTSCNFPTGAETPLSSPTPAAPLTRVSSPTPFPPTPSRTPTLVVAFPKDQPVNCRFGPGTSYAVIGELRPGRQAEMIGKNADATWWYVKNPSDPSTTCWLAADFTDTEGNVDALPVVNPPGIAVTAVKVSIDPPVMNVACDGFPRLVTINVQITTNGPTTVMWRWEESSTGDVSPEQSLLFEEGGAKTVQDLYQVRSARDYTMVVRTIQPNEVTGTATFKAVCTP